MARENRKAVNVDALPGVKLFVASSGWPYKPQHTPHSSLLVLSGGPQVEPAPYLLGVAGQHPCVRYRSLLRTLLMPEHDDIFILDVSEIAAPGEWNNTRSRGRALQMLRKFIVKLNCQHTTVLAHGDDAALIAQLVSEYPQDEQIERIIAVGVEQAHEFQIGDKWQGTLVRCEANLEALSKALSRSREETEETEQAQLFYVSITFRLDQQSKQVKQDAQNITASLASISARAAPAAAAAPVQSAAEAALASAAPTDSKTAAATSVVAVAPVQLSPVELLAAARPNGRVGAAIEGIAIHHLSFGMSFGGLVAQVLSCLVEGQTIRAVVADVHGCAEAIAPRSCADAMGVGRVVSLDGRAICDQGQLILAVHGAHAHPTGLLEGYEPVRAGQRSTSALRHRFGCVVLRSGRCVLTRREGSKQLFLPATEAKERETALQAATRAVAESCDIHEEEIAVLPSVAPTIVYDFSEEDPVIVTYFAALATGAPPAEEEDSDDDDAYDWFNYTQAQNRVATDYERQAIAGVARDLREAIKGGIVVPDWPCDFGPATSSRNAAAAVLAEAGVSFNPVQRSGPTSYEGMDAARLLKEQADLLQRLQLITTELTKATSSSPSTALVKPAPGGIGGELMKLRIPDRNGVRPQLPVTLLSGFLGAGKTTLMKHILENVEGLRVAVIVNDMAEVNIDAALIEKADVRQEKEKVVELSNGCICCTLREDLLTTLMDLAGQRCFDYVLIESSGISEPLPVAETFTFDNKETGIRLDQHARLDTLVTVVDGANFLKEIATVQTTLSSGQAAYDGDDRALAQLLVDQIEFANVILLNKCDLMTEQEKTDVKKTLQALNQHAIVFETTRSILPITNLLGTGLFTMTDAEKHENWLKEARIGEHTPETEEFGIRNFVYRRRLPFHPERLRQLLDNKESLPGVIRAKGFCWVATRPRFVGTISIVGHLRDFTQGQPWWAAMELDLWPEGLEQDLRSSGLWQDPHGDRSQELVVIGRHDRADIETRLDACLLTEAEMQEPQPWCFPDSLPAWEENPSDETDEHAHGHAH